MEGYKGYKVSIYINQAITENSNNGAITVNV